MKKPKISVIIPIYNAAQYLSQCLQSVVDQTLKDIEIVCVNDGSTDSSSEIINNFAQKYNNIKIINQKNQGVVTARIVGYENSSGEYIGWVDADDFIEKDMFEKLYNLVKNDNNDVAICNYQFFPSKVVNKKKWYHSYNGVKDWKFLSKNAIQWNKIVSKNLLEEMNFPYLLREFGEGCYSLVLMKAKSIVTTDEMLYYYRVGHTSLSSNFKKISWYKETIDRAIRKVEYVKKQNYEPQWVEFVTYNYLYYNLIMMIVAAFNDEKKIYLDSKKVIKREKLFSKKYKKYLVNSFSISKYYYFKIFGVNSFLLMKTASRIVLK